MSRWIPVANVADCPPGSCLELAVAGRIVAIFNVAGDFHALDGVCPHQGGPLGKGQLEGHVVTCPWHGWQFDVRNGQHQINAGLRQPLFELRVVNEQIMISVEQDNFEN